MTEFIRKSDSVSKLMSTKHDNGVVLLEYPLLNATGVVSHCFSTRLGGISKGIYSSMNLSYSRGDNPEAVTSNFRLLADAKGWDINNMVFSDQTHTTNIKKVTIEDAGKGIVRNRDYTDIDGLITNVPGLILSTFYADCVPLYFVDPVNKAIGLSHSGWKGTVGRIGKATIDAMASEYGTVPSNLVCAIGPSICQDCYEVSLDVAEAFMKEFPNNINDIIYEKEPVNGERKFQLNLWKACETVMVDAGVKRENIAVTDICTCCNPELLFSHRASHGKRGNLGAFLCLN
ncbi:MAG: peptidoglycan editing factor PgeF [Lachnospiraceae bacterium]|nr:peptidoglycan editing factor PgeF [Candidatus Colinaster scatohippi]